MKLDIFRKTTARDAFAQSLAVCVCTGVLFLFVALTYSQITLPRYTTQYTEKDVQQVVNLIITILATVMAILFSYSRLTNEAETKTELREEQLTIPRLHVHFEAASGSKSAMGLPVIRNKEVWKLVAFYFVGMIIFSFIHSVLSVIFVIEAVISDNGELVPVPIPLSIDIPETFDGKTVDPCSNDINAPGCTYMLALHALSSQLVTMQPYTIAGVEFQPPNGTMGLPYSAMKHFQNEVASALFDDAHRRYCLPVLDPHLIKCTEVPINHTTCESEGDFVKFKSLNASNVDKHTGIAKPVRSGLYKITSPYPESIENYAASKLRIDDNGYGVMVIQVYSPNNYVSLIGGADAIGNFGYGSQLHRLMYHGADPDTSEVPVGGAYDFAARCELTSVMTEDGVGSSWRQVDFTLKSGVLRANVTEEHCPSARSGKRFSGFADLAWALEGAGSVISGPDGYSAFFTEAPETGAGTSVFRNMSRLDRVVNQIYHIVQTGWTESALEYAKQVPRVTDEPIWMTTYPHLFVIRISWNPVTCIALVLSLLIALNALALAGRWLRATYRFSGEGWNLLRPVDLMAYSLAASEDLIHKLDTKEHRAMEMRGTTTTVLRPYAMDLIGVAAKLTASRTGSTSSSNGPTQHHEEKAADVIGPSVSVRESNRDLERGEST